MDVAIVNFKNKGEKHVLAKVKTNKEKTVVLNMGKESALAQQKVNIQKGQKIDLYIIPQLERVLKMSRVPAEPGARW